MKENKTDLFHFLRCVQGDEVMTGTANTNKKTLLFRSSVILIVIDHLLNQD